MAKKKLPERPGHEPLHIRDFVLEKIAAILEFEKEWTRRTKWKRGAYPAVQMRAEWEEQPYTDDTSDWVKGPWQE